MNSWCPYCSNQKLCNNKDCQNCLNKSFASHPNSDFWSDKNIISPDKLFLNSNKKYWFECYECNHSFESKLSHISNGRWCPYCAIPSKKLCDCNICYNKTFASHPKSIFWSNKNDLQPDKVFKNSNNKYWFDCYECNHSFEIILNSILQNRWCPYCSNMQLCDCNICYNKSFASHPKSIFWSDKNKIQPNEVTKCNNNKFWFDCYECNHSFETQLSSISKGSWCSYCSNRKLCNNKNCKICLDKSFVNNPLSKFWYSKNILSPRDVFKFSTQRIIFNCDKCNNEFESILHSISRGRWCPFCKKKTELKLFN